MIVSTNTSAKRSIEESEMKPRKQNLPSPTKTVSMNMPQISKKGIDLMKPPNWTIRKQLLKQKTNAKQTPSLATNIDYHLDMLQSYYKQTRKEFKRNRSK